jgi:hypothetical protein
LQHRSAARQQQLAGGSDNAAAAAAASAAAAAVGVGVGVPGVDRLKLSNEDLIHTPTPEQFLYAACTTLERS